MSAAHVGRRGIRELVLGLGLLTAACAESAVHPPQETRVSITDNAHLDLLSVGRSDTALTLHLDHADHPQLLRPEQTTVRLGSQSRTVIGTDTSFRFLGAPGAPVWHLDAGWSVRGIPAGVLQGDTLTIRLLQVSGPGRLAAWRYTSGGQGEPVFRSDMPLPQHLTVRHNAHAHRLWSVTAAGHYTLHVEARATLAATGQLITSGVHTLTLEAVAR